MASINSLTEIFLFLSVLFIVYVGYSLLFSYWYAYWFDIAVLDRIPYLNLKIPFADRIFRDPRSDRRAWTLRWTLNILLFLGTIGLLLFVGGYLSVLFGTIGLLISGQGLG